jgi:hypothetical protein
MRTDPILEELYQIRAELMRKAGSADVFFAKRLEHQAQSERLQPQVRWQDLSAQRKQDATLSH